MIILGLNYFYHDTAASIVKNGELLVAIEEERLTRSKHTWSFPSKSVAKVMDVAGIRPKDVDHVAVSIRPWLNASDKLLYGIANLRRLPPFLRHEVLAAWSKQRDFKRWYETTFDGVKNKPAIHYVPHHLCHAIGSFYVSPFDRAAILSIDGAGEWATSFLGYGEGTHYESFGQSYFPASLGAFYESITQFCGFQPNYDEGKTMGLAPLGDPEPFYEPMSNILRINEHGGIEVDLSFFTYQYWGQQRFGPKFVETFGPPRVGTEFPPHVLNVAAAAQMVLEDRILDMSRYLHRRTEADYLVLAGGVALNSVANGRVVRETPFKDVYVMPAAGDNGTGIGASFYTHHKILKQPRKFVHLDPYVGNEYSGEELGSILRECKLKAVCHEDICSVTAQMLHEGKIIGWFQGKMEIGPRALGNRSILANPTDPNMKDKINAEVKHREAYRPFAPSCTVESKEEFFETVVDDPFMLKVCYVRPDKRSVLPAITHVDGSARLQTVSKDINPRYHELLSKFGALTGVPVLLNTSFNIMGEPIVESPLQAIRCFFSTGLDVLILGDFVVSK